MKNATLLAILMLGAGLIAGCAKKAEENKTAGPPAAIITVTQAQARDVLITEQAVGDARAVGAPLAGLFIRVNGVPVARQCGKLHYVRLGNCAPGGYVLSANGKVFVVQSSHRSSPS